MKRFFSLILLVMVVVAGVQARDTYSRDPNVLPAKARTVLTKYFPRQGVNHIKIDRGAFGSCDYDVILSDGSELEFGKDGRLKEVDCGSDAVPSGLILKDISRYVSDNYKRDKIVKLEVSSRHYEVELSSGIELKFDRSGRFLRVED